MRVAAFQGGMAFDWHHLLFGQEDWTFLVTVVIRTVVMFVVILVGLRLLGKRGVHQLSVFELGVIVGLGSAAGDPMFYTDVGLLSCIVVFLVVIALYQALMFALEKSDRLATTVEGRARIVIRDGELRLEAFRAEAMSTPELFMQLRHNRVAHLGQVALGILEPNGDVSVFYRRDDDVTWGLPVLPDIDDLVAIERAGHYACQRCGHTRHLEPAARQRCPRCDHDRWVTARRDHRVG